MGCGPFVFAGQRADGSVDLRRRRDGAAFALQVVKDATAAGLAPKDYVVQALKDGTVQMSCEDPDAPQNWPRVLFVWRSNLLGSSGKGHEYFCKHLLGTENGIQGKDLGAQGSYPRDSVSLQLETTVDDRGLEFHQRLLSPA